MPGRAEDYARGKEGLTVGGGGAGAVDEEGSDPTMRASLEDQDLPTPGRGFPTMKGVVQDVLLCG